VHDHAVADGHNQHERLDERGADRPQLAVQVVLDDHHLGIRGLVDDDVVDAGVDQGRAAGPEPGAQLLPAGLDPGRVQRRGRERHLD